MPDGPGKMSVPFPGVAGPSSVSPKKQRPLSLYSQWEDEDVESEDEDEAYLTPEEGLSEIEEEPDRDMSPKTDTKPLDTSGDTQGARQRAADVVGTGPSTIRRAMPGSKTKVLRRQVTAKRNALAVDQAKVLAPDLDIVREVLTQFFTKPDEGGRRHVQ